MTQQEFADSLGYAHKSTINKIESGKEDMSYQKILVLLKEYMLEAKTLFADPDAEMGKIDALIEESKKPRHDSCLVYIHGLNGSGSEADFYSFYTNKHDVIGLDYEDGNPWEVKDKIIPAFEEISRKYKIVYVVANSIGAFYAYWYLSSFQVEKAFFISPLVNMKQTVETAMKKNKVSLERLKREKVITTDNGQTLSYDFYMSLNEKDNWKAKTHVLYGEKDRLLDKDSVFEFVARHDSSLTIMKNGEHLFHTPGQIKFLKKWINEYL
ncbi:MAG: helix-turn-helix transcriptional regulator [Bacilli bacterium]|nr:helix-turn-helix transcriptional regulator [Bacilli bacterium]